MNFDSPHSWDKSTVTRIQLISARCYLLRWWTCALGDLSLNETCNWTATIHWLRRLPADKWNCPHRESWKRQPEGPTWPNIDAFSGSNFEWVTDRWGWLSYRFPSKYLQLDTDQRADVDSKDCKELCKLLCLCARRNCDRTELPSPDKPFQL